MNQPLCDNKAKNTTCALRICDLQEFFQVKPGAPLVSVLRLRTIWHADGRISQEKTDPVNQVQVIIHELGGNSREADKIIIGDFPHPDLARDCARILLRFRSFSVQLINAQLKVSIEGWE